MLLIGFLAQLNTYIFQSSAPLPYYPLLAAAARGFLRAALAPSLAAACPPRERYRYQH